jgi:hypothetical protein
MGETDALILAEEIRHRLRALPDEIVAERQPQRDRDRLPGAPGGIGGGAQARDGSWQPISMATPFRLP